MKKALVYIIEPDCLRSCFLSCCARRFMISIENSICSDHLSVGVYQRCITTMHQLPRPLSDRINKYLTRYPRLIGLTLRCIVNRWVGVTWKHFTAVKHRVHTCYPSNHFVKMLARFVENLYRHKQV